MATVTRSRLRNWIAAAVLSLLVPALRAYGQSSPDETPEIVAAAAGAKPEMAPGPVQADWESIRQNYKAPEWFRDAKFGIMMHWGLYSVPAHGSEWYVHHMYGNPGFAQWHVEHFGPLDKFGYKDFIPLFTCEKYDPDAWALLFKKSGARYIIPTAEHHDGWANWDSDLTEFCATKMGPKRDLIGDMAKAVRKQGLKFGASVHRMNHYEFIKAAPGVATDLDDPKYDDFYWTLNHGPARYQQFLESWVARSCELIDKYQLDMLWYDMGGNSRRQDPIKTKVAAYYLNRAKQWGKEVSLSAKGDAFQGATIMDYEREGRAPMELTEYVWQADDPIADKFGYVEGLKLTSPRSIITRLIENTSKNGNLLLNISPRGDGTIPQDQQEVLLAVGKWLDTYGEAIYGTRPWIKYGEGPAADNAAKLMADLRTSGFAGRANDKNLGNDLVGGGGVPRKGYTPADLRFTTKGDVLYVFVMAWPEDGKLSIKSLGKGSTDSAKRIATVEMLGSQTPLTFTREAEALYVTLPPNKPDAPAVALKVTAK